YRGASADREAGVVFRSKYARKTTPSALAKEASRHLIYGAATPPCCDARRGLLPSCDSFADSLSASTSCVRRSARIIFKHDSYRASQPNNSNGCHVLYERLLASKTGGQSQNFHWELQMTRFLVFVLLTAVTALGTEISSPSVPPDQAPLVTFN